MRMLAGAVLNAVEARNGMMIVKRQIRQMKESESTPVPIEPKVD